MKFYLNSILLCVSLLETSSFFAQINENNSFEPKLGTDVGTAYDYRVYKPKPANSTITITQDFVHKIGEFYEGGVIFKLWKDSMNVEHGLIVSITNVSTGIQWSNVTKSVIGKPAFDKVIGLNNLAGIINQKGHISSAAFICDQFVSNGKDDWYLPSMAELDYIMEVALDLNRAFKSIKGAENIKPNVFHWTSTEYDAYHAYAFCMHQEHSKGEKRIEWKTTDALKTNCYAVRAVRSF